MSALIVAVISAPLIAILSSIIDDCLEWRKDINIKVLLIKGIGNTLIFALIIYPFSISLSKGGYSYESQAIAYIFGFGCLVPIIRQLIALAYVRIMRKQSD
jgi:hypothetical protein